MTHLSLFIGAGGGELAAKHILGWKTVGYVEINEYCQKIIAQRIKDGLLDEAPIFTDIQAFLDQGYAAAYHGMVDVVSGGFPCQDISCAGKGAGIEGESSGLWSEMARVVCQVRPKFVFVENSPMLTIRGFGTVIRDLAEMGFDAEWGVFSACAIGAPHMRKRLFCLAISNRNGLERGKRGKLFGLSKRKRKQACRSDWWLSEPAMERVVNGLAHRVDRTKAIGNGQVPAVAATAFRVLAGRLTEC